MAIRGSRENLQVSDLDAGCGHEVIEARQQVKLTSFAGDTGFRDAVRDVELARTLAGFHFRNSCLQGANLGRTVGRYVEKHYFQPVR